MAKAHKLFRVQNDTGEPINFTVLLDNEPVDLTNCSVNFIMKSPTGLAANVGHTSCTVISATAGTCQYSFSSGDLSEVGLYTCDLQLTDANGKIITEYTPYDITVREENG